MGERMEFASLIAIVTIAAVFHYLLSSRRRGVLTLDSIFVISQWILAVGTLVLLDPKDERDEVYAEGATVPMLIYILVSISVYLLAKKDNAFIAPKKRHISITLVRPPTCLWALLALSIAITVTYYAAVGYSVFRSASRA